MATHTRPFLMTGAALASAVAVVAATPSIMPSVAMPSTTALSRAAYELTTFADLLSITPEDISNTYFGGWGFKLKPFDEADPDWAAAYLSPFANCNEDCAVTGPSGIAYMALDALINGNGAGIDNVDGILQDPSKPYQPDPTKPDYNPYTTPPWSTSALNYYFEGGPGPGTAYLVIQPFANPTSPLYNPTIASVIILAAQGLDAFSDIYIGALAAVALAAQPVPVVGPYIYGLINSYLGPSTDDEDWANWGYYAGLSGVLRYVIDVVLTGGNPYPPYGPPVEEAAASTLAVASVPAEAVSAPDSVQTPAVDTAAEETAPADSAPDTEVADSAPVTEVADSAPVTEVADSAPVTEVVDSTPAADITPVEVESSDATPEAGDTVADATPEAESPAKEAKRPVRSALQRAAKNIGSALKGAPAAASADAAADAS